MSRSSMRLKHYRPISADLRNASPTTLSSVNSSAKNGTAMNDGGVFLINYKRSSTESCIFNGSDEVDCFSLDAPSPLKRGSLTTISNNNSYTSPCTNSFHEKSNAVNGTIIKPAPVLTSSKDNKSESTNKAHPMPAIIADTDQAVDNNVADCLVNGLAPVLASHKDLKSDPMLTSFIAPDTNKNALNSLKRGDHKMQCSLADSEDDLEEISEPEDEVEDLEVVNSFEPENIIPSKYLSCNKRGSLPTTNIEQTCAKETCKITTVEVSKSNAGSVKLSSTSRQISSTSRLIRDKLRDSKTWALRKSFDNKDNAQITLSSSLSTHLPGGANMSSDTGTGEGRISRLFSLRRSSSSCMAPIETTSSSIKTTAMPRLAEEEEQMLGGPGHYPSSTTTTKNHRLPKLPREPLGLTTEQLKRRHIVASLVENENNYVASLQRLVHDYKKQLEESNPPIIGMSKVDTLFYQLPEILHCHLLFRIALIEVVDRWDIDEKIGDVFVATFSKAIVLENYSDFINNFSEAMDTARSEAKRKSALADFLAVKQIEARDRVSFFGLMVKPVQRFPQFILILQDLLKETPTGHADRISLQLALTTLESLAEMLNERRRESEQVTAFKQKISNISGKAFTSYKHSLHNDANTRSRFLIREDDVIQMEFNSAGHLARSKSRRLLLLNDFLLCVTVSGSERSLASDISSMNLGDFGSTTASMFHSANERLSVKWAVPVSDVELIDGAAGGTLGRLLMSSSTLSKRSSLGRGGGLTISPSEKDSLNVNRGQAENLAQDMNDLMHDFEAICRINTIISSLRGTYDNLTSEVASQIMSDIQKSIRQKDEEMAWLDACCLYINVKVAGKSENYTFQLNEPNIKKEWIVELRLAQLALDVNNSPAWDVLEIERSRISSRMPLFVKSINTVFQTSKNVETEVTCGCSYALMIPTPTRTFRLQTYVWANTTDGHVSQIRLYVAISNGSGLKESGTICINKDFGNVKCMEFVPECARTSSMTKYRAENLRTNQVWVALENKKIIIFSAMDPDKGLELGSINFSSEVTSIRFHYDLVWVGLSGASMAIFRRNFSNGSWEISTPQIIQLDSSLISSCVSSLLPIQNMMLVACSNQVYLIDSQSIEITKHFSVQCHEENSSSVLHMAQSGVGLWLALENSSTICLYHTETFRHLQDINIASNVSRVLTARDVTQPARSIYVTALLASRGLLWVGTNVGIALTIPLPRLEGVPIISGRANISYHAHFGPINFFMNLQPNILRYKSYTRNKLDQDDKNRLSGNMSSFLGIIGSGCNKLENRYSNGSIADSGIEMSACSPDEATLVAQSPSNSVIKMRSHVQNSRHHRTADTGPISCGRRTSRTLPRGFSLSNSDASTDVYGLYGDLLNIDCFDCSRTNHHSSIVQQGELEKGSELHRSDPELSTITYRVSTLDRRVRLKITRPRSLDMSSWSVESRTSNSSSDQSRNSICSEGGPSPNISRNSSFQAVSLSNSFSSASSSSSRKTVCRKASSLCRPEVKGVSIDVPKTVTTLMGGRGYINWRRSKIEKHRTSALAQINNTDAYLILWEMKL